MPFPISLTHKLANRLADMRKEEVLSYLRPDGKTQVTIEYDEHNQPIRVDTIIISTQHREDVTLDQIKADMIEQDIHPIVPEHILDESTTILVNATSAR